MDLSISTKPTGLIYEMMRYYFQELNYLLSGLSTRTVSAGRRTGFIILRYPTKLTVLLLPSLPIHKRIWE